MDDRELGRLLDQAVPSAPPTTEALEAIVNRSQRRRTRGLVTALVVALVAGPAIGVSIAERDDAPTEDVAAGRPATDAGGSPDAGAEPDEGTDQVWPEDHPVAVVAGGEGRAATLAGHQASPLERLFLRTSADGVAIRAYKGQSASPPPCPPDRTCPPPPPAECLPSALYRAELSNEGAVSAGGPMPAWGEVAGGLQVLRTAVFGVPEGAAAQWVAVRAGRDVARVRATFPGGGTDEMQPVQGLAVLAHHLPAPPPAAREPAAGKGPLPVVTVEGLDASGAVVATQQGGPGGPPPVPPGCMRPHRDGPAGPHRGPREGGPRGVRDGRHRPPPPSVMPVPAPQ